MPCHVDKPSISHYEWVEWMLCQACQMLSAKQIEGINDKNGYVGMAEWYVSHLLNDYMKNQGNDEQISFYQSEAHRMGYHLEGDARQGASIPLGKVGYD